MLTQHCTIDPQRVCVILVQVQTVPIVKIEFLRVFTPYRIGEPFVMCNGVAGAATRLT